MYRCKFKINNESWVCEKCGYECKTYSNIPPIKVCSTAIDYQERMSCKIIVEPAEQEEQAKREAEQLRPEGEKLGWTFEMVVRYAAALKKWVAAGRPVRTNEEVEAIENICKACEKYEPDSGRCHMCGCKITTPGIVILSKAKLATESCPKELW